MTAASSLSTQGCNPSGPIDLHMPKLVKCFLLWWSSSQCKSSLLQTFPLVSGVADTRGLVLQYVLQEHSCWSACLLWATGFCLLLTSPEAELHALQLLCFLKCSAIPPLCLRSPCLLKSLYPSTAALQLCELSHHIFVIPRRLQDCNCTQASDSPCPPALCYMHQCRGISVRHSSALIPQHSRTRLFCGHFFACLCLKGFRFSLVLLIPMSLLELLACLPHPQLSHLFVEEPLPDHEKTQQRRPEFSICVCVCV